MPSSQEQLDNWFTYHPPTGDQASIYAEIRAAEAQAAQVIVVILNDGDSALANHDNVNAGCRHFAEQIDIFCPDSADKSAAIRCVRLARNALNDALVLKNRAESVTADVVALCRGAEEQLRAARWQANSAIACGGK